MGFNFKKHTIVAYAAGAIVSAAWWLWIDAHVITSIENDPVEVTGGHYVPGIIATIALIIMNIPASSQLSDDGFGEPGRARFVIFAAFFIGLGAVIAAIWIAIVNWFDNERKADSMYPPVMLIVQNVMIFAGGLMLRFSKKTNDDSF